MAITDYKQKIRRLQDKLLKAKKEKFLAEQKAKKMDQIIASGNVLLETSGKEFLLLSKNNGSFDDTVVKTTLDCLDDLQFIVRRFDYDETKLRCGGTLETNNVSISYMPTDKYEITLGPNSIILCETDMEALMRCLKSFDE